MERGEAIRQSWEQVTERDGHVCFVCGEHVGNQLAHRIPQSKLAIKRYGQALIHHPLNMRWVCSLECNKRVEISIKARPREADALAREIRQHMEGKW